MVETISITGTTTAGGAATSDSRIVTGEVLAVIVDGKALTDSANLDLQPVYPNDDLGEKIIENADVGNATINAYYPRRFVQDSAGVDLVIATGQKAAAPYVAPGVALRATISAGGATKAFTITVVVRN